VNFFKRKPKTTEESIFSLLKTDMHSHLLPGIDDGSPDLETSIFLIKGLAELGYTKLITTPHIMWDMYRNTPEIIHAKLDIVREEMVRQGINIELDAAAEYFLDEHVEQLLKKNERLLTFGENYVLVEFSLAFPSSGLKDIIFEMQMQGYLPVIAHPERYVYLEHSRDLYEELKGSGCLFQLNALSVSGHYGKTVQELANYLIKKNYYDLIGTDLHNTRHLAGLRESRLTIDTAPLKNKLLAASF
jgi:tyrosine-protein phosphatase YwqE